MRFFDKIDRQIYEPNCESLVDSIIYINEFANNIGLKNLMQRREAHIDFDTGIEISVVSPDDKLFKLKPLSLEERNRRYGLSSVFHEANMENYKDSNNNFIFYADQVFTDLNGLDLTTNSIKVCFKKNDGYESHSVELELCDFIRNFDIELIDSDNPRDSLAI